MSCITSEHGKQPKHLDREECQAEDLARGGQAACKHGGRHESSVGGQRGDGELVDADPGARIVKKEDIDG